MDLVGRTLADKYVVVRPIGQGGMGAVYEANDVVLGRRVALKTLFDDDPRALARFEQEADVMAAVRHPNIATVYDFRHPHDAPPFIVMELVDGTSLASVIRREGPLPPDRALRIATQMLDALETAHRAGVVHRDVKPANVLLAQGDLVKIVDFGIAKVLTGGGVKTTTGAILGTPAYLSPEQILGGGVDARTDIHAVGLVLYEMLTGRRMSREATPSFVGLPPRLANAIARATAKVKEDRFASASEMTAALTPPRAPAAIAAQSPAPSRARLFAIGFGCTALLATAAFAVLLARSKPPPSPPVRLPIADAAPTASAVEEDARPEPTSSDADAPPTASVAITKPPRANPNERAKCWCVHVLSNGNLGARVCLHKEPASCACRMQNGTTLCRRPTPDSECTDFFGWTGTDGDPCLGEILHQPGSVVSGKMQCEYCYHRPMPPVRAVQDAPCSGYEPGGKLVKGIWRCD